MASLAVQAGADGKAVRPMLGNASSAMALDVCADLLEDDLDTIAGRLDEEPTRSHVAQRWATEAAQSGPR